MTGQKPYLRIEHVNKTFGEFQALRDVSLDIYSGEFICFLGPSGCGKTTLLRAIAGLDIQTSGRVVQDGKDISSLPPSQRDFGIVFQSYALFPNLSVADNVGYGLVGSRSRAEIKLRVSELLQLVGLSGQEAKYPAQLSGGQQQRVALARALAMSPGLLLLDEPLSALDARVRQHLRSELKQLQRRLGVTTIMVTHDQEEALAIADRIVVMNEGRIEQIGTPTDVYRHPEAAFVADFVGQMNFLMTDGVSAAGVRLGDIELAIDGLTGVEARGEMTLCIRPEDVQVRNLGNEQNNIVRTRINHLEFLGSFCRAELNLSCGRTLRADFSINAMRDLGLVPGQELMVALPPDRLRIFANNRSVQAHD
ncbi:putative 2-aminoethylphosphonate ABC transporter ATP-binding protein [Dongia sp.]|uniref:putative 2-aminoethylphosphonate ABC transporter ATP-binding protein n=1 Tax=Dongia sp. TaxID=1977262 RepID=UPI0035AEBDFA